MASFRKIKSLFYRERACVLYQHYWNEYAKSKTNTFFFLSSSSGQYTIHVNFFIVKSGCLKSSTGKVENLIREVVSMHLASKLKQTVIVLF